MQFICQPKNKGIIETIDLIAMGPFNKSFVIIMSGNLIGLRIGLSEIMNTINKLPGAKIFLDLIERLAKLY